MDSFYYSRYNISQCLRLKDLPCALRTLKARMLSVALVEDLIADTAVDSEAIAVEV